MFNTTYSLPTEGTTWTASNDAQFRNALTNSVPGDVIVLQAGATFNVTPYVLPAKSNPSKKWIYIQSSNYPKLPPPGTRVNPTTDEPNMPIISARNGDTALEYRDGANYWRLVGIEITSSSTTPAGCTAGGLAGTNNCSTANLIGTPDSGFPSPFADHIVVDRCYLHGTDNLDVGQGFNAEGTNFALIDSYVSDIHKHGSETQAFVTDVSPGPFKIIDNYLESGGENIFFGGGGGKTNPYVPSDAWISGNLISKPLTWVPYTNQLSIKNTFEIKSGQRILINNNTIQHSWIGVGGQGGYGFVFTVRTSQSGDIAVIDDITVANNILQDVVAGISGLEEDDECGLAPYTSCANAGEAQRWLIFNNLFLLRDPSQPLSSNNGFVLYLSPGLDRVVSTGVFRAVPTSGSAGTGYVKNDVVQVSGGTTPARLLVTGVGAGGAVTQLQPTVLGSGYSNGSNIPTTGGSGSGLQVTIVRGKSGTFKNVVFDHNTAIPGGSATKCGAAAYYPILYPSYPPWPTDSSNNVWLLNNALCALPTGDDGQPIANYMVNPSTTGIDISARLAGNVFVNNGSTRVGVPSSNMITTLSAFRYDSNYSLTAPIHPGTQGLRPGYKKGAP
jgi:hypothetical protein